MATKRQQKIPTLERISKMDARDITRLTDDTLRKLSSDAYKALADRATTLFNKRMALIQKRGLSDYAFASKYVPFDTTQSADTRQQAARQIAAYRQFFTAKTSTVSGIRKVLQAEESRLSELSGTNLTFESEEQRKNFWSAYMEFMNQHAEKNTRDNSARIQRLIGGYMELVTAQNYQAIIDKVMEELKKGDTNVSEEEKQNSEWFRKHFE